MSRKSSICPPQIPERPSSEADKMQRASLCVELRILGNKLRQRNLDNAVKLAIEAAQGRGELVEHFAELGRRYGGRTDTLPRHKKAEAFRIIPGGLS